MSTHDLATIGTVLYFAYISQVVNAQLLVTMAKNIICIAHSLMNYITKNSERQVTITIRLNSSSEYDLDKN